MLSSFGSYTWINPFLPVRVGGSSLRTWWPGVPVLLILVVVSVVSSPFFEFVLTSCQFPRLSGLQARPLFESLVLLQSRPQPDARLGALEHLREICALEHPDGIDVFAKPNFFTPDESFSAERWFGSAPCEE